MLATTDSSDLIRAYSALRSLQGVEAVAAGPSLQVPMLVVCGVQSTGKTSFIESIVGWGVGYTDSGTATMCPVRYVLRSGKTASYVVDGKALEGRERLREAVQKHMQGLPKIVKEVLEVEIQEEGMFDIDITDLPGLKDGMEEDTKDIANILAQFFRDPRTIPVVMCRAEKSHDVHTGMDRLQELGLNVTDSFVIMNYFNKQIGDLNRYSDLNTYVSKQKSKFPKAHFVMIHYHDGIEKDKMDFEQLRTYYRELPRKEQEAFDGHLARMSKDQGMEDQVREAFGVRKAHTDMQNILLQWIREHLGEIMPLVRRERDRWHHEVEKLRGQVGERDAKEVAEEWRKYTTEFEREVERMFRDQVASSTYEKEHERAMEYFCDASMGSQIDYWLHTRALEKQLGNTATGKDLGSPLGPHAAFDRLQRVLCYNLFKTRLDHLDEARIKTIRGNLDSGCAHTANDHPVIQRMVEQGLNHMKGTVLAARPHILAIYTLPLRHIHDALAPKFPSVAVHRRFHELLNATYERLLRGALDEEISFIVDSIDRHNILAVDLPSRMLTLIGLVPNDPGVHKTDPSEVYHDGLLNGEGDDGCEQGDLDLKRYRDAYVGLKRKVQGQEHFTAINFVEGGLEDIHQGSYLDPLTEDLNRKGRHYFSLVKGQVCLEVEAILNSFAEESFSPSSGLLRKTHELVVDEVNKFLQEGKISKMIDESTPELKKAFEKAKRLMESADEAHAKLHAVLAAPRGDVPDDALANQLLLRSSPQQRKVFYLLLELNTTECSPADVRNLCNAAQKDLVQLLKVDKYDVHVVPHEVPLRSQTYKKVTYLKVEVPVNVEGLTELIHEGQVSLPRVPEAFATGHRNLDPISETGYVADAVPALMGIYAKLHPTTTTTTSSTVSPTPTSPGSPTSPLSPEGTHKRMLFGQKGKSKATFLLEEST